MNLSLFGEDAILWLCGKVDSHLGLQAAFSDTKCHMFEEAISRRENGYGNPAPSFTDNEFEDALKSWYEALNEDIEASIGINEHI